jgi:transposase-like protein
MARHTADWWQARIADLERGASTAEVARRHGVRELTLIWWRSALARRARGGGAQRFVPVIVQSEPRGSAPFASGELEVVVEGKHARITLRGHIAPAQLACIVAIVRK